MINISSGRVRGNEPPFNSTLSKRTVTAALDYLVSCELAFGGHMTVLTDTQVTIVTRVLDCIDTTAFSGTSEEMRLLVEVAATYTALSGHSYPALQDKIVDVTMKVTKGIPLHIHLGADMIRGQITSKIALVAMLGAEVDASKTFALSVKDLCAVLTLVHLEGISVEDALGLATA